MRKTITKGHRSFLKLVSLSVSMMLTGIASGQITLIAPTGEGGFESGTTFTANGWTAVNGSATSKIWQIGTGQAGYTGTAAAFIGNNSTTVGSSTAARTVHFYRSITIPPGAVNITLTFKYKQALADNGYDFLKVFLNGNTPVNSTAETAGQLIIVDPVNNTDYAAFTAVSATIPNSFAGSTNNLIFSFQSDDQAPQAYGAVDDISLTYIIPPCAPPSAIASSAITSSGATISWNASVSTPGSYDLYYSTNATAPTAATVLDASNSVTGITGSSQALSLNAGTSYYVWVRSNCGAGSYSAWNSASAFSTVPANNDVGNAINLNVNTDYNCGAVTPGTTASATASTPAPSCNATGANDDVWFKFMATGAAHRVSLANVSGSSDMNLVVYSDAGITEVTGGGACANVSTKNLTGLTSGQTYYVRVYTFSSSATTTSNFNICVGTPPPPPVNDNAAAAVNLTVNADLACGVTTNGTTVSATQSPDAAPDCSVAGINDDVWYTFTATHIAHRVAFTNVTTGTMAVALYTGTPGNLTFVSGACNSGSNVNFTNLLPGTQYYARVYTTSSAVATTTTFTLCLGTFPAMAYASSTTAQPVTGNIATGSSDQIIRTEVIVTGINTPLTVTQLSFNTTGSTNPADILNAKVYYTGTSTTFGTTTPFGTAVANPNGTFTVTGSQILSGATSGSTSNYFFLVYDVACNAASGNLLDAQCTSVTVGGSPQTPTVTAPSGNRNVAVVYSTVANGDWNAPAIWSCGIVPGSSSDVTVNHDLTISTAGNVAGNVTIASGKTVTISAGDLTTGPAGGGNKNFIVNGTLTVTGGLLHINGNLAVNSGATFNQSAGNIEIDGNANGIVANSASGVLASFKSALGAVTGGNITIVDPPATGTLRAFEMNLSTGTMQWSPAHTLTLGDGVSTDPSAGTVGFALDTYAGLTGTQSMLGSVIVNGGNAGNRFASTTTATINGTFIKGNVTVNPGSEFRHVTSGTNFTLTGNIINNGIFTTTGTITFATYNGTTLAAATTPQAISGSGIFRNALTSPTANFAAITINNSSASGVTFADANALLSGANTGTVSGTLTMTAGIINTGSNALVLGISGTTAGTYTYVAGMIAGKLKRWIGTATGNRPFHLGSSSGAKTASINFTVAPTAAGTLTAEWVAGNAGSAGLPLSEGSNTFPYITDKGYWRILAGDGLAGGTYTATFVGAGVTDIPDYTKITIGKRANASANWSLDGVYAAPTGSNASFTISRTGITTGFSEFGILSGVQPLPVKLVSFTGRKAGMQHILAWTTAEEQHFSHFELQRSSDGRSYSKLATIPSGKQNGSDYTFTDAQPLSGTNMYRLNMVDADGKAVLSGIVKLIRTDAGQLSLSVYPNPVQQQLRVTLDGKPDGQPQLQVMDITGKVLQSVTGTVPQTTIDMGRFAPGSYLLRYTDNSQQSVIRISKE